MYSSSFALWSERKGHYLDSRLKCGKKGDLKVEVTTQVQLKSCHPLACLITYTHICRHTLRGPLWQMSLFKLTEVHPDTLPLLHHPEKSLSSSQHPLAPSSMLIMENFCLVSSFSLPRPPLLLPCLTPPPPCLCTPIHTKPLRGPPPHVLTPLFIHTNSHIHSAPSHGPVLYNHLCGDT